jgi:hypothetical protein
MTDGKTPDVRILDDLPLEPSAFYILELLPKNWTGGIIGF